MNKGRGGRSSRPHIIKNMLRLNRIKHIENKKFNRLTAIKIVGYAPTKWLCRCECGREIVVRYGNLTSGNSKSCGCENIKRLKELATHKMSGTSFYNRWRTLKARCNNKNNLKYKNYGGRGIKNLWKNFLDFKKDMFASYVKHINKYGIEQTSIDRINNNGHYCKKNCRWATQKIQQNNRRDNIKICKMKI